MYVFMYVCMYVTVYVCMYINYVCMHVCRYLCMYVLLFIIKHAPSPGSDTTYYNVTSYWYLVIGRGCRVCLCSRCRTVHSLCNV